MRTGLFFRVIANACTDDVHLGTRSRQRGGSVRSDVTWQVLRQAEEGAMGEGLSIHVAFTSHGLAVIDDVVQSWVDQ